MDPNACLERFLEAYQPSDESVPDLREAFEAHKDLREWLAKGGFAPDWDDWEGAKEAFDGFKTLPRYTSLGCYPLAYITDCDVFCHCCAVTEGFTEQDGSVHWEGEPIDCDLCGEPIESAYGVPESEVSSA